MDEILDNLQILLALNFVGAGKPLFLVEIWDDDEAGVRLIYDDLPALLITTNGQKQLPGLVGDSATVILGIRLLLIDTSIDHLDRRLGANNIFKVSNDIELVLAGDKKLGDIVFGLQNDFEMEEVEVNFLRIEGHFIGRTIEFAYQNIIEWTGLHNNQTSLALC